MRLLCFARHDEHKRICSARRENNLSRDSRDRLDKLRFLLSTEQYEVLLAFEETPSLGELASRMGRDPSVISRALKSIAETALLLEKQGGKWRITPLGRQFNRLTRGFLKTQTKILDQGGVLRLTPALLPVLEKRSALLLLGTQHGFQDPIWGPRNNPEAEQIMEKLLAIWRKRRLPVVFCQHLSPKKGSPLREGTRGSSFLPSLSPKKGEKVVQKSHNSAFIESRLQECLTEDSIRNLILVGFTTNHCVDATTRSAFDLGYNVFILSDAVVTFDRVGPDGKTYTADVLHSTALASLHQEYATILESEAFLNYLSQEP